MASIRKRKLPSGAIRWLVSYRDGSGKRRFKQFATRKAASSWMHKTIVSVEQGTHTPDSQSVTVAEAGEIWLRYCQLKGLEPVTVADYESLFCNHIVPAIGAMRLNRLTTPGLITLRDDLLTHKSPQLVRRVFGTLKTLLYEVQRRGLISQNVAVGVRVELSDREKRLLEVGVDIPSREEVRPILDAAPENWRPLFVTAFFTGMRISELRGLAWSNVDFDASKIRVRQRADRNNRIGSPKSKAGSRDIPMTPMTRNALREWKLRCPNGELNLVFPTGAGRVESYSNIVQRGYYPTQKAAGVLADGKPKYSFHSVRHFFASWCINGKRDGGLELSPKRVQFLLGHSSLSMTMDVYGHLFKSDDDAEEFAQAEKLLMACNTTTTR